MEYYTVRQLKEYASQNNIQLTGLTLKADILNAIRVSQKVSNDHLSQSEIVDNNKQSSAISNNYYTNLPDDMLIQIALNMNLKELNQQCRVSQRMASLCRNNNFWYQKLNKDFGKQLDWKRVYIERITNEIVKMSKDEVEKKYLKDFGDINFKDEYYKFIKEIIIVMRNFIGTFHYHIKYGKYEETRQDASAIVSPFITSKIYRDALLYPEFIKYKDDVKQAFEFFINTYPKEYSNMRQIYDEMFGDR